MKIIIYIYDIKINFNRMKHIKNFESFNSQDELNEGIFDNISGAFSISKAIENFLEDPSEEDADKLMLRAFAKTFSTNYGKVTKDEVLSLPIEEKIDILTQALEKKKDPKVGILTLQKRGGKFVVGGLGVAGINPGGVSGNVINR